MKRTRITRKIKPNMRAAFNMRKDRCRMKIELPGVDEEDINLRFLAGGFMLNALGGNIEYRGDYTFNSPVDIKGTEVDFRDDLLTINILFKSHEVSLKNNRHKMKSAKILNG